MTPTTSTHEKSPSSVSVPISARPGPIDLDPLFTILNDLIVPHRELARFRGWLEAHNDNYTNLMDYFADDDTKMPRLLRLVGSIDDNFILLITRLQEHAVDHDGQVPEGCVRSALRRLANYAGEQIAVAWKLLMDLQEGRYGPLNTSTPHDTYKACKRKLKELLEALISACQNVDFQV